MSDHENSLEFYRMRHEQELTLASQANSDAIREIHEQMADGYRQLIDNREISDRRIHERPAEQA